ncbi:two-component system regulatory protein YycI [Senegalia massiliensis]|nr:two-component system regulatory protein YycI [Senegalia massiliensis]
MDWSKAKKIMIIAFIVVNVALLSTIIGNDIRSRDYITTEQDVKERLKKINVDIKTDIPKSTPNIQMLEVEYQSYDKINSKLDIARKFINSSNLLELAKIDERKNSIIFESEHERFKILKDRKIVYEYKSYERSAPVKYDYHEVASNFLEDKGFKTSDYKLTKLEKNNDIVNLTYTKEYQDTMVEKSYMKFTIRNARVIKFERLWLNTIKEKENNIKLRPATDSLLKLLSVEGIRNKTIKNIVACYYFDPNNTDVFEFDEFKSGDAFPAWKVEFTDGIIKYLYEE